MGVHAPPTHWSPAGQLPHWSVPPHPLLAAPQVRPSALQVVTAHVSHWWLNVSQTWGAVHVPHESVWPQPSLSVPQAAPSDVQDAGEQAPQVCVVGSHVCPTGQVPQLMRVPHWLSMYPHVAPSCAHVLAGVTHAFAVGSHVSLATHPPQSIVPPQTFA
jgi:hypothetical protein